MEEKQSWEEKFDAYWWHEVEGEEEPDDVNKRRMKDFMRAELQEQATNLAYDIINDLESNPNEDGSISPNIQHWIEKKKIQLRKKYL